MKSARDVAIAVKNMALQELQKLNYVQSVTLIGKEPDRDRIIESVNDLDTIIIVEGDMTKEKYNKIEEIYMKTTELSTPDVDVSYSIKDGPFKPVSEKEKEVFSHVILHTEESYCRSPLMLVKNSWQYEMPYFGKPVAEIQSVKGVDEDMLINGALGLNHLIGLVKNDESAYLDWEDTDSGIMRSNIFPLKFIEANERLEFYFYSILRCASNTLRWTNWE
ncbi:hypothetical protein DRJ17_03095 [Candidatus Woesearchaeota archaeon]|nr:MAG: hypothetical protein DRJ17_03095 [Candidatus Woesearchaeota archaeon]